MKLFYRADTRRLFFFLTIVVKVCGSIALDIELDYKLLSDSVALSVRHKEECDLLLLIITESRY